MRNFLAIALLMLALPMTVSCKRKPPPPDPKPQQIAPPAPLANYQKAIAKMQRTPSSEADMARARRTFPGLIAQAETRMLRTPDSAGTCAAWDAVAANAMRQNDPALVHLWGTLADRRCERYGRQARYWAEP